MSVLVINGRAFSRAQGQWQPRINAHDPNPPITLESTETDMVSAGAGLATFKTAPTIYAVAGERECWSVPAGQTAAVETTGGRFDATLSREAMKVTSAVSEIFADFGSDVTEAWIHFYLYQEGVEFGSQFIVLQNGLFNCYAIDMEADGSWSFYYHTGGFFEPLGTTAGPVLVDAGARIDWHVKRHATDGIFRVYSDGALIFEYLGDTATTQTVFNRVWFEGLTGAGNETNVSQLIVANADTRDMRLATLIPNAAGARDEWLGTFADVDNSAPALGVGIMSPVIGETSTFLKANLNAAYGVADVHTVVEFLAVSNDPLHPSIDDVNAVLRSGGTDFFSANLGLTADETIYVKSRAWELNPATDNHWTVASLNLAEIGIRGWFV